METKVITRVNNVEIMATSDEQKLVAIRPICEALGIAPNKQIEKIKEDEDFSSVGTLRVSTGADGKQYEMFCLPIEFIFGWLFSINPKNVKEEARDNVRKYRMECYKALYHHFFGSQKRLIEQNKVEISLLEEIASLNTQQHELKKSITEKRKKLDQIRSERLHNEPTLFD